VTSPRSAARSASTCSPSSTSDEAGFQFVSRAEWIESLGISWHLGVDGISLFLLVLTGVLFPIAIVGASPDHDPKPYYAWLLVLMAGSMGVFVALDLFVFFVFFEIVLVPMYFLIGGGATATASTRRPSSSSTRCSARRSCWSASSRRRACTSARRAALTFDVVRSPKDQAISTNAAAGSSVVRDRVRGEGAAVPAAHLAARRPHRGTHGRLGDPGRRDAQARHLRIPALRALPVPRGLTSSHRCCSRWA
jgi:hypothetical protein